MRCFEVKVQTDGAFRSTYYVEADNLISGTELRDYVAKVAAVDLLYSDDDEAEELEVLDPVELEENIVFDIISDVHVRSKLIIAALNNLSNVVLGIYQREDDYTPDKSEYFMLSAAAGQEADVTAIGKTDKEHSRESVINSGWTDCISQLKRYWQIPGVIIATGLFTIETISEEEYSLELSERELVLA